MHQQTNVNKRTNPVISYRPLSISFEHTKNLWHQYTACTLNKIKKYKNTDKNRCTTCAAPTAPELLKYTKLYKKISL